MQAYFKRASEANPSPEMPHTPPWQVWGGGPWRGHHLALFESLGLSEATPTWVSLLDLGALSSPSPWQLSLGLLLSPGYSFKPLLLLLL